MQQNTSFFVSEFFHHSWESFKKHWLLVYGLFLPPLFLALLFAFLMESFPVLTSGAAFLASFAVYFLLQMVASALSIRGQIAIVKNRPITLKNLLPSVRSVLMLLATQAILVFIVFAGLLLFIYPGIVWSLKYLFAPYLAVDKGMTPKEALAASAKMTEGIKWDLVAYIGATAVLTYFGLLMFIVGFLVSAPVAMLSYAVLYTVALKRLDS